MSQKRQLRCLSSSFPLLKHHSIFLPILSTQSVLLGEKKSNKPTYSCSSDSEAEPRRPVAEARRRPAIWWGKQKRSGGRGEGLASRTGGHFSAGQEGGYPFQLTDSFKQSSMHTLWEEREEAGAEDWRLAQATCLHDQLKLNSLDLEKFVFELFSSGFQS
nr:hypothetical protein Itr_chr01CG08650 [Ipomoea trifida]